MKSSSPKVFQKNPLSCQPFPSGGLRTSTLTQPERLEDHITCLMVFEIPRAFFLNGVALCFVPPVSSLSLKQKLYLNIDVTADEDMRQMLKKSAVKEGRLPVKVEGKVPDLEQNLDLEKTAMYKMMVRGLVLDGRG